MAHLVVDTDVLSLAQRGQLPSDVAALLVDASLFLTVISLGELHKGAESAGWGQRRRALLQRSLVSYTILPIDAEVARIWGAITGRAALRGRPRPVNDTWIAASCLRYELPLVTINTRDFTDFVEHEGLGQLGRGRD